MKTSAGLLPLALFLALPAAAQRAGSSSSSHGTHASSGSSPHGSSYGSSHGTSYGPASGATSSSSGGYSTHSSYAASSSRYSPGAAGRIYQPAAPASGGQASGRYVGSTPAARPASAMQSGFVRAPFMGSQVVRPGRPPLRTDTQTLTTSRGPFITSVPRPKPVRDFFFGFDQGFHHRFRHSFCGSFLGFGFGGFNNSFDCFGSPFADRFFWPWRLGFGSGLYYGAPYSGFAPGTQPADQSHAYEPPSAPGTYTPNALTPAEPEQPAATMPVTLLQLKDGTMYGVTDYWLDHGQLHYVTSYGGENAVPLERVDLDKTVELNSANGLGFVLRNAPSNRPHPAPALLPLQPLAYPELMF